MKSIYYDDIKETCGAHCSIKDGFHPMSCVLANKHTGNHKVCYYEYPWFLSFFRNPTMEIIEVEWTQDGEIVYLRNSWRKK